MVPRGGIEPQLYEENSFSRKGFDIQILVKISLYTSFDYIDVIMT